MTDQMDVLRRNYLPVELMPCLEATGFAGTIAVQARQMLEETSWLLELAKCYNFIKGVVGWVDLRSDSVREQLEQFAGDPTLVGVRHVIHDEPEDDFMLRSEFQRGLGLLAEFGLTYDLLLFPRHLPGAVKLVAGLPDQPFVLDHLAKPGIRESGMLPWGEHLRQLAEFPNVYCKLSGLVTEGKWKHWQAGDFRRYLDVAIEAFGTDRVMIGSDWPVCTLSANYVATMNIVVDYVQQFPNSMREKILGANCARFYGIKSPAPLSDYE